MALGHEHTQTGSGRAGLRDVRRTTKVVLTVVVLLVSTLLSSTTSRSFQSINFKLMTYTIIVL